MQNPTAQEFNALKRNLKKKKREQRNLKTFIKCFIYHHQAHGSEKKTDQSIATNLTWHQEF